MVLIGLGVPAATACGSDARDAGAETDATSGAETSSGYARVSARLADVIRAEMDSKALPALSIALVDDQEVVWAEGFGVERDPGQGAATPASAETVYRVGSVSKLFTDLAVMQRVEAGRLELDRPVRAWLPGFSPGGDGAEAITLRHLMSHRSGLVREPPVGHYFDPSGPTLAATVESLNRTHLVYAPGVRTKYSNAGIAVVGRVLEVVEGRPFDQVLDESLLGPLGMSTTSFVPDPDVEARLADAIMWTVDGREFEAPGFQLGMSPAGSMYSTVLDLSRFLRMLFAGGQGPDGPVLEAGTLERMWTPQFAGAGARTGFGLGFFIGDLDGERVVRHGGAIYGFSTELAALPDQRLGVVVASSVDLSNSAIGRISEYALRAMLAARVGHELPEFRTAAPLDPEMAEALEGRWTRADGSDLRLLELGGRLFAEPLGGGLRARLAVRADTLVFDDRRAHSAAYVVEGDVLTDTEGGVLRRVAEPLPRRPPPALDGLIGEYGWDHNTLFVFEEDGLPHVLIEWFFRYPLERIDSDLYRFPASGLYDGETLRFERDGSGRTERAILGGAVVFERRSIDGEDGQTFRIEPVRPVDALRAAAIAAEPPGGLGGSRQPDLVEVRDLDSSIRLDIRYASNDNFMGATFYTEPRAYLQRPAAEALVRAHRSLASHGFGVLIHDGYRPWHVTKMFWDATPDEQKLFVADPASGSRHNRGAAVDLTLYELDTGAPVTMVSGYDEFSARAFPDYPGGTHRQRWLRELLREAMEDQGFTVYEWEWWHFDYDAWAEYPVLNQTFEELAPEPGSRR